MTGERWTYGDPFKVVEYKENGLMMKNPKVRQWAKGLSRVKDKADRQAYLKLIPEQYRDAVEMLARSVKFENTRN